MVTKRELTFTHGFTRKWLTTHHYSTSSPFRQLIIPSSLPQPDMTSNFDAFSRIHFSKDSDPKRTFLLIKCWAYLFRMILVIFDWNDTFNISKKTHLSRRTKYTHSYTTSPTEKHTSVTSPYHFHSWMWPKRHKFSLCKKCQNQRTTCLLSEKVFSSDR